MLLEASGLHGSTIHDTTSGYWRASPGALRDGTPLQGWAAGNGGVRRGLKAADDGDVLILTAVLSGGLDAVEAACQQRLLESNT